MSAVGVYTVDQRGYRIYLAKVSGGTVGNKILWRGCSIIEGGFGGGPMSKGTSQRGRRERTMSSSRSPGVAVARGANSVDRDVGEVAVLPRAGGDAIGRRMWDMCRW